MWDKPLLGSDIYKYVNIHTVYIYIYIKCSVFIHVSYHCSSHVTIFDTTSMCPWQIQEIHWETSRYWNEGRHTHTHTLYLPTHSCNSVSCLSSPELMLSAPMIHVRLCKHWDLIFFFPDFFFKYTNDKRQEFYLIEEEKMIHMETHLWNHWVIQVLLLL